MLKARVSKRKKGQDLTAVQSVSELPTLAQAIEMREMEVANQPKPSPMLTADQMQPSQMMTADQMQPSQMATARASRMTVSRKKSGGSPDADVYDRHIEGGYGKSMGPRESGEEAVQRISGEQKRRSMKVKRKGK